MSRQSGYLDHGLLQTSIRAARHAAILAVLVLGLARAAGAQAPAEQVFEPRTLSDPGTALERVAGRPG